MKNLFSSLLLTTILFGAPMIEAKLPEDAQENMQASQNFLKENSKKDGIITTDSGLQYEVVVMGKGEKPGLNDVVTANYRGTLISGRVFDSSFDRDTPLTFKLTQVIQGWQEVIQLMPQGSRFKAYIPPELAYGESGAPPVIGPNQVLIFEIELIDIKKT